MASASKLDSSLNITLSFTLNIEIKLLTFRTSEATSYVESGEESLSKQVPTYQLRTDCILRNFCFFLFTIYVILITVLFIV